MAFQTSTEWPVFKCTLFRRKGDDRHGQWERYSKQAQITVQGLSVSSLTVRDEQDGTLLADFPKDVVHSIDIIRCERILRINHNTPPTLALQFSSDNVINAFIQELNSRNFAVIRDVTASLVEPGLIMPDLRESSVRDLILNLLFDDNFEEFVSELSSLIDEFRNTLSEGEVDEAQSLKRARKDEIIEEGGSYDEFGE